MWKTIKCFFGFHSWSEWKYLNPTKNCKQKRTCSICGIEETRIQHRWNYLKNPEFPCEFTRECKVDKIIETECCHIWGNWVYESPHSCKKRRVCLRCGEKEYGETAHQFGSWIYIDNSTCDVQRICKRCKKIETLSEQHIWTNLIDSNENHYKKCTHCGKTLLQ